MPRLAALRKRRELSLRPDIRLSPDQLRSLVLAETGDEAKAMAAAEQLAWNQALADTPQ